MVAPVLGLPALLQAIATIGVGGAIGYKAQKDLQPVIKQLKASPEDMDSSELRMLRALLMPNQAIASELKDMTTSKSVGTTGEGTVIGPRAEDIEQVQEEIEEKQKAFTQRLLHKSDCLKVLNESACTDEAILRDID